MAAESDDHRGASSGPVGSTSTSEGTPEPAGAAPQRAGTEGLGSKAPWFVKRYRTLHLTWQVGVLLVGVAIIAGGMAMLVLPGPGWLAIFLGLAVLATEFVWAQRALRWSKQQASKAANKAMDPRTRRRNTVFLIVGVLLIAAGTAIYIQQRGLPDLVPW